MNDLPFVTIEDCEKAWDKFSQYKETAEQHEFPMLFMLDMQLIPRYNDLHHNWDPAHGQIFMNAMNQVFDKLGISGK